MFALFFLQIPTVLLTRCGSATAQDLRRHAPEDPAQLQLADRIVVAPVGVSLGLLVDGEAQVDGGEVVVQGGEL